MLLGKANRARAEPRANPRLAPSAGVVLTMSTTKKRRVGCESIQDSLVNKCNTPVLNQSIEFAIHRQHSLPN